jgi:two-component system NtrC family sensor kinase
MTIRTKVWLLVAGSVAITTGPTVWLHTNALRRELTKQNTQAAEAVSREIAEALIGLDADADDMDLALVLTNNINRHARIQRIELHVEREDTGSSVNIVAPRGDRPEIRRLGPAYRLPERKPEYSVTRSDTGEDSYPVQLSVDLQGPWKATLLLSWRLGDVDGTVSVTKQLFLTLGVAQLGALVLLAGFLVDRAVVRRLDVLARAMRDVGQGDLERRVRDSGEDEVGRLAQGFNRMLDQLSAADREIRAFNQRLGQEIEAATQDLSKKNLALAQLNRLLIELRRENASKVRLATLGQLAAQLAHEIGTPLSSVSGHLQLALLQRDLPGGLRERLDVATREIARIGRIVRDYLDSTRSLAPERKETSLRRVIEEAVEVTGGVERAGSLIEVRFTNEPKGFLTDPGLLRQIVINLLANALDAVERGGQVTLSGRSDGGIVEVVVADSGSGIPPEDLRRIFEPFYTTKGRGKGTGLGLAICRELVAALGGSIAVESAPGQGSTFTVRLPLRGAPQGGEARPLAVAGGAA